MGKIIDDIQDGLEHLPPDMRDRLEHQISELVNAAVREHGREEGKVGSAADLAGSLASDIPRASDEQERAAAQRHVAENFARETP